jgi:uncharacterized protein with HEPN domain
MSSRTEYLRHILDETDYLIRHSNNVSMERFLADETLKRAFVRSIEVIGEASKKVPDEVKRQNPRVEWRAMAGMRDRLIHGYFGVDYELVWDVVENKVPTLREQVRRIVEDCAR